MIVTNIKKDDKQPSMIKSLTNLPPISSYSCYSHHTIMITTNNEIYVLGCNLGYEIIGSLPKTEFTRFYIKDQEGQIFNPISACCRDDDTLYMLSKFLAYSGYHVHTEYPHFYDMNNMNPVAIFGCNGCCYVTIDDEGSIILVPYIKLREQRYQT